MKLRKSAFVIKIILAGDGAVGKTSLRIRYLGLGFNAQYIETIGADFALKMENVSGKNIKFQIWDLAGQPRFRSVLATYYTGARGALLVFDVTRRDTYENLISWIKEIWKHNGYGIIPIIILGNKNDLRNEISDCVDKLEALNFCRELSKKTKEKNFEIRYLDTSAKTGLNVSKAFQTLGEVYFDSIKDIGF
ncbi:MAG: Rab family GTPase [Candidatus Hodarchaeales archaeon]